jgi:hypothetical protein
MNKRSFHLLYITQSQVFYYNITKWTNSVSIQGYRNKGKIFGQLNLPRIDLNLGSLIATAAKM